MIKVMQHYEDGGEVEFSNDRFKTILGKSSKTIAGNLSWGWDSVDYRIKEEKQKVSIDKWLIKDVHSGEYFIMESLDVDLTLKDFPSWVKVKLLETNVLEL